MEEEELLEMTKKGLSDKGLDPLLEMTKSTLKKGDYDEQFVDGEIFRPKQLTSFDYLTSRDDYSNPEQLRELQAQRQSWGSKAASGLGRVGTSFLTEVAKLPVIAGGVAAGTVGQISDIASGQDNTDFMTTAFDNAWVRELDDIKGEVNEELLPVYASKAITEGSIGEQLMSIDMWATEGADAAGFLLSMLVPGQILKAAELGKGISSVGKGILRRVGATDETLNAFRQAGAKGAPTTTRNLDLYSTTIANTGVEAGLEASQVGRQYEEKNIWRTELDPSDPRYLSLEDLTYEKGKRMRNTFALNAGVLLGPNAIMSKIIWGGPAKKPIKGMFNKSGRLLDKDLPGLKQSLKKGGQDFALGFGREGFIEEGLQTVIGDYYSQKDPGDIGDFLTDLPGAYADMLGTTDGQKAIVLGGLMGGGVGTVMNVFNEKGSAKNYNKLVKYTNNALDTFDKVFKGDTFVREEDGTIVRDPETGRPEVNFFALSDKLKGVEGLERLSAAYDIAVQQGDVETINKLRDQAAAYQLILPFLSNEELGIEGLREYLGSFDTIGEMAELEGISKEEISNNIMSLATQLDKNLNTFNVFSSELKVDASKGKEGSEERFFNSLRNTYISNKINKHFFKSNLQQAREQLHTIAEDKGISVIDELNEIKESDSRVKTLMDNIDRYTDELNEVNKTDDEFWKPTKVQGAYNNFIKEETKKEEEAKKEEEITNIVNQIDNATEEELKDIEKNTDTSADKYIKQKIKQRKDFFKQRKEEEKAEQALKDQERSEEITRQEADEEIDKDNLSDHLSNFNNGEATSVPSNWVNKFTRTEEEQEREEELDEIFGESENQENINITKVSETEDSITFTIEGNDKKYTIPKESITEEGSTGQDFLHGTDGSVNSDINKPTQGETIEGSAPNNGTQVISTNKETGEKFNYVEQEYLDYEREPRSKVGEEVGFQLNERPLPNYLKEEIKARNIYNEYKRTNKISEEDKDFLIDYLPIDILTKNSKYAPIGTKPNEKYTDSLKAYNESTRELRLRLIDLILKGNDISNIFTTIEYQHPGLLQVDQTEQGEPAAINDIKSLYHFKGLSETKKIEYIKKNIGVVGGQGKIEFLNGKIRAFTEGQSKKKSKGEVYMLIPMANGRSFPLKLNIEKISDNDAELITRLYEIRLQDRDINKSTTIEEIQDKELLTQLKESFATEKKIIGKGWGDLTVKDLTDFFIYDNTANLKTRVAFIPTPGVKGKGSGSLAYGNPSLDGAVVPNFESFERDHFKKWLTTNKRYNIKFKKRPNETSNASIETSNTYINYLIDTKKLNTNAIVGENNPTFAGNTNIYLASNSVYTKEAKQEISTSIETKKAEIERRRQEDLKGKQFISVNDFDLKKGDILYNLYSKTEEVANEYTVKAFSVGGEGMNQYLKGVLLIDNKTKEEKWWNSRDRFTWNDLFKKADTKEINAKYDAEIAALEKSSKVQKIDANISNSKKDFVPLKDIEGTKESKEIEAKKKKATKENKIGISDEIVDKLINEVAESGLIKEEDVEFLGENFTNEEKFNKLVKIAKDYKINIESIKKMC